MIYSPIKCLLSAAWSAAVAVAVVPRCSRGPCLFRLIRQPQQQQLSSATAAVAAGRLVATWAAHSSSVISSRTTSRLPQWSLEACPSSTVLLRQLHFFLQQQPSRVTAAAAAQAAVTFVAHSSSSAGTNDADSSSHPQPPQQQQPHSSSHVAGSKRPSSSAGSQPQHDSSSSTSKRQRTSNSTEGRPGDAVGHRKQGAGDNKHQRSSSSGGARSSQQLPAPVLTARLKEAQTAEQLAQLVQQHAGNLNHFHLSAASTRAKALRTEGVPLQQLSELLSQLRQLAQQLQQQCGARELANIIWSCAYLGSRDTAAKLLPVLLQSDKLQDAAPQEVSNVVWAAATLQLHLTAEQLQQLLQHFASRQVLQQAKPQEVSNTLWAVASMQQQVPQQQLQQMLDRFQQLLPQAKPQAVSNTLWAVASMQQQVPPGQLQQMLDRFQEVLPQAKPQEVSNTLLACGKLQFMPRPLLSAVEQQPKQLQTFLAAANSQALANTAWACGHLGYSSKQLPDALLQQAVRLLQSRGGAGGFTAQALCNLCWSAAVLDRQQCVPLVLQLAAAVSQMWGSTADENLQQLYQVHFLWLLDSGLPAPGQGLSGVLSQQQLEQCREQQLAAAASSKASDFQQGVFAAAQQLPADMWQQPPALEQVTADGVFSIDIAATTAAGVRVAIEADGPTHFIQPGNTLTGGTLCRNRALAARGYVVLSIPYWEWDALQGADSKQQYLLAKLQAAARPTQAQRAGSTAAVV